jgi:hypothetical protein
VLALCFIISGILPLHYTGGGNSASTTSSSSTTGEAHTAHPAVTTPGVQKPNGVLPPVGAATTTPPTETAHSLSPTGTATITSKPQNSVNAGQSPGILPAIDLSQPLIRLGFGVVVLALSIIVLIVTRRRRVSVQ